MKRNILIGEVDGKSAVCFNTGLDSSSFAKTKMSQALIENGFIVYPDGKHEIWKPSGVKEIGGSMTVYGNPFSGKRLDLIINDESFDQQTALQAVVFWIRAKLFLGDKASTPNPGATFFCLPTQERAGAHPAGSVFFSPENLSNRCLLAEEMENSGTTKPAEDSIIAPDYFNCPDFKGMEAAAFCAGVMLYIVLAKTHPYPVRETIFQDMREGVFMPVSAAAPGLDKKLASLIQRALMMPIDSKKADVNGTDILNELQNLLFNKDSHSGKPEIVSVSSLFSEVSPEENAKLEREKNSFLNRKNKIVKSKRYVIRNRAIIMGAAAVAVGLVIIIVSMINNQRSRPTTAGLSADTVVVSYYEAFSRLDHLYMEACINGASKADINAAASLYVIDRQRVAYDIGDTGFTTAQQWKESGGELPAPDVFGITDFSLEFVSGSENESRFVYRARYLLWPPNEDAYNRIDILTLEPDRRGNWRITEILRTEN